MFGQTCSEGITARRVELPKAVESGLTTLLEAKNYARDLDADVWSFAVEMETLRDLKLNKSDLRWMVGRGLVEHAVEVTTIGDTARSFQQPASPLFRKRTCFVLTAEGEAVCASMQRRRVGIEKYSLAEHSLCDKYEGLTPRWDSTRQELTLGNILIKCFKVPAANQETVLTAFEEEAWPPRIDDPLSPQPDYAPKKRLQETIKSLNRNQRHNVIHFLGDGSGEGIRWELTNPSHRS